MNKRNKKKKLIALIGPTGIGKTKISIEVSKKINAEIQYRYILEWILVPQNRQSSREKKLLII
ncbi:hypothetical protein ES702_04053 [subsurface metagenome]